MILKNKKLFAILTLVCFMFTFMPMAAFAGDSETIVEVNSWEAFKSAATTEGSYTIKLTGNFSAPALTADKLNNGAEFDLDVSGKIIDLNDCTITVPKLALVFVGENFTIKNGTIDSDGASYGLWIGGNTAASNAIVDDVTVVGGINVYNTTKVTLKNNEVDAINYYAVWGDEDANIVIESGTYNGSSGKAAVLAYDGSNGGTKANISITGGIFSTDVKDYVVEGCNIAENNGTYTVTDDCEAAIGDTKYATLAKAIEAAGVGDTVTLLKDVETSSKIEITKNLTIDGNGKTLTYTGSGETARAITVENTVEDVDLTIKNLTVDCTSSYCQRGINYNTNGSLNLDTVTVKGENVSYAVNLPGSSDDAVVTITESNLTGNIALNIWGENMIINVTDSVLTSVDKTDAEGYAAIQLNNDGNGNVADGTTVTISDGSITAEDDSHAVLNLSTTGVVNIDDNTTVTGDIANAIAIIGYNNGFYYAYVDLAEGIEDALEGETVEVIGDITLTEAVTLPSGITLTVKDGKAITLANGGSLVVEGTFEKTATNLVPAEGYTLNYDETTQTYTVTPITYTVTFNMDEDDVKKFVVSGDRIANIPAKDAQTGKTFVGWFASEDGGITLSDTAFTSETVVTGNLDLYPKYELNSYTVTFNSNGGSDVASVTVDYGKIISAPTEPTKSGCTFAGWYTDEALSTAYDFEEYVAKDFTLYAKWTSNAPSYDYSGVVSGGSSSSSSSSSSSATTETVTPNGTTVTVEKETAADGTVTETTTTTTATGETTVVEKTTETTEEGTTVETTTTTDATGETSTTVTATLENGSAVTNNDDAVEVEVTAVEEAVVEAAQEAVADVEEVTVVGTADAAVSVSATNAATGAAQTDFVQPMSVTVPVDTTVLNNVTDTSKLTMAKVVTNEDGTTELVYMGGSYDKATGTFNAKVDEDGDYILVEKADLVKIELTIDETAVKHNDRAHQMDVAPKINAEVGRTELPLRYLGEALGFGIDWNNNVVTITKGDISFSLTIGQEIPGFGTPYVEPGADRTMVSARYISEMLGANVIWDPVDRQVIVVQ